MTRLRLSRHQIGIASTVSSSANAAPRLWLSITNTHRKLSAITQPTCIQRERGTQWSSQTAARPMT